MGVGLVIFREKKEQRVQTSSCLNILNHERPHAR